MSDDIDIGQISEALNDKMDRDAGNPATLGKERITSWGMPSDTYEDLTLGAEGTSYTAPANGWFQLTRRFTNGHYGTLANDTSNIATSNYDNVGGTININICARKGDIVTVYYGGTIDSSYQYARFQFIYAEGEI